MRAILFSFMFLISMPLHAFDHSRWSQLLDQHVTWHRDGVTTSVDYQGFNRDRDALHTYLEALSAVPKDEFDTWSKAEQFAFLTNAYNAFTIELILREDIPSSIRRIGGFFRSPWGIEFFSLLGEDRTLDEVEHEMIRGNPDLMDPRVHFAVNCASVGCPALRDSAFTGDDLETQLADSTERFLRDRQRNRYDASRNRMEVSKIFDWYEDDFIEASGSLGAYLAQYADALDLDQQTAQRLANGDITIRFTNYDWALNTAENTPQ